MALLSFLDREHSVAPPGYSRWLVPPAALAIHLCIGQAYAFSVFNIPMTRLLGITAPAAEDWSLIALGRIFSIALAMLGLSAAMFGKWLEKVGPRRAMAAATACFAGGFFIAAIGVKLHQIALVYLGYGVIGGIGLGLGYISPVSTLIKWFPDRPGMATGMAIMGFGGGAMIGSPLSVFLMDRFKTAASMGVMETFVAMGLIYGVFMLFGVLTVRIPPPGWKPEGYIPPAQPKKLVTTANVEVGHAWRTPQFWMLWGVLCMNVTAGIGVLGQASPMIQEMFPGRITPAAAAGFVGLLSLFNLVGRFFWSSLSDPLGRKRTYMIYFLLGTALYALVPTFGRMGSVVFFVAGFCVILSMYGGGFATIPAYLRDLFGTLHVSAIHGRLLTAWSVAAVLGPELVGNIRKYQIDHKVPNAEAYSVTMYIMAGLLVVGLISNALVSEVDRKYHCVET
ncbi:MAG TPA: OFA family MFS transporter [Planctomycetota bacterium]|nr:OFA family MFS transporter [Planctomycetota bacterium]